MNYWLVVGSTINWMTAFEKGNIWGLKERQRHLWENLNEGDILLFYVTQPVQGIIGSGILRTKFKQNQPLWPQELSEHKLIWPLRFEFDVESCWPPDDWIIKKLVSRELWPRAGFQPLSQNVGEKLLNSLRPAEYYKPIVEPLHIKDAPELEPILDRSKDPLPSHDKIRDTLVEIGRLQNFVAEAEYQFDIGRLDAVWRRVELSVPTYVFEVQVGGDIYHALAKLKHAFDLWNSHIYIVASQTDLDKVGNLLMGTFHEIETRIRFVELGKVDELYKRKKAYLDLEKELGIYKNYLGR